MRDGLPSDAARPAPTTSAPTEDGIAFGIEDPSPGHQSLRRAGALLAPAMLVANLLGYAFNIVTSRWFLPAEYGALGSLLGVSLVAGIPALALQPVVARHTAVHVGAADSLGALWRTLTRWAVAVGAASALVVVVTAPLTARFLHLDSPWPVVWLALQLATLPLVATYQGMLQGVERFRALAVALLAAGVTRLAFGAAFVSIGWGVTGAMAATAAGSAATAVLGAALVGRFGGRSTRRVPRLGHELSHTGVAMAALLVMANVDVLLARHYLPATESGLYAVGAIVAKGMFWAPQFVVVLLFPRLANPDRHAGIARRAAIGLATLAGVGAGTLAIAARPVLRAAVGSGYERLAPDAWAFAAVGGSLALAQLLLYARIAQGDRRITGVVAAVAAAEVVAVAGWLHDSLRQIVLTALVGSLVLVAVGLLAGARRAGAVAAGSPARSAAVTP
ncbi:MAG TPA: polysaccharide biosynthesis C-terminal domain-containing protein [Mycobacteriales bacterium]|nr:polysaccharide biosynthesis C-terminal domain-containing protein [Mycobacteriales bacterium]